MLWWIIPAALISIFLISITRQLRPPPILLPPPPDTPVRIEVLNGCGKTGLAGTITKELRKRGCDVVFLGNAPEMSHDQTIIIDRGGGRRAVELVGRLMGCRSFIEKPDGRMDRDVTVIVGMEYEGLFQEDDGTLRRWGELP